LFPNKDPVIVAWKENSQDTIDLTQHLSTPQATITNIITTQGQTTPAIQTAPTNNIPLTEIPIFIEAYKADNDIKLQYRIDNLGFVSDSESLDSNFFIIGEREMAVS